MAPDELDHKDVLSKQALNFLSGAFCNLKGQKRAQMGFLALLPVTATWTTEQLRSPLHLLWRL